MDQLPNSGVHLYDVEEDVLSPTLFIRTSFRLSDHSLQLVEDCGLYANYKMAFLGSVETLKFNSVDNHNSWKKTPVEETIHDELTSRDVGRTLKSGELFWRAVGSWPSPLWISILFYLGRLSLLIYVAPSSYLYFPRQSLPNRTIYETQHGSRRLNTWADYKLDILGCRFGCVRGKKNMI